MMDDIISTLNTGFDSSNKTVVLILPFTLLASLYGNTHISFLINVIRSTSQVITALLVFPVVMLIVVDFVLYSYRVCLSSITTSAARTATDTAKLKAKPPHGPQRSNSYFNLSNYIKNYSLINHANLMSYKNDRKNSTDSLTSGDSLLDLPSHPDFKKQQEGKVYLRRGDSIDLARQQIQNARVPKHARQTSGDYVDHMHARNVVFSVSN